jgi:hypothetical protein
MAITFEQALTCDEFHQTGNLVGGGRPCDSKQGPVRWRRNGKTKTWKTRPGEFQIPIKHGLRSYDYITNWTSEHDVIHAAEDCPLNQPKPAEVSNG